MNHSLLFYLVNMLLTNEIENQEKLWIGEGEEVAMADRELRDFNEPTRMKDKTETTSDFTLIEAFFSIGDVLSFRVEFNDDNL